MNWFSFSPTYNSVVGLVIGLRAGRSGVRFPERAGDFSLPQDVLQFVPERVTCRYPMKKQSLSLRIDRPLCREWATDMSRFFIRLLKWRHWEHTHTVATHGMTSVKCAAILALDRRSGGRTLLNPNDWCCVEVHCNSPSEATINPLKSRGYCTYQQFNIHKFYVLPTQCIYVFCVDLRTNSDYFPKLHLRVGFYNRRSVFPARQGLGLMWI